MAGSTCTCLLFAGWLLELHSTGQPQRDQCWPCRPVDSCRYPGDCSRTSESDPPIQVGLRGPGVCGGLDRHCAPERHPGLYVPPIAVHAARQVDAARPTKSTIDLSVLDLYALDIPSDTAAPVVIRRQHSCSPHNADTTLVLAFLRRAGCVTTWL